MGDGANDEGDVEVDCEENGVSGIDGDEEDTVWWVAMAAGTGLDGDLR